LILSNQDFKLNRSSYNCWH